MLGIFKNRRLFKEFVLDVKEHRCGIAQARERLKELPIDVVRAIGKEIIYKDYDGYNFGSVDSKMAYFDNLDRWQKEFFIEQRLYKLYAQNGIESRFDG